MKAKASVGGVNRKLQTPPHDFTIIEQDSHGNIGVALHAWNPSKGHHDSVSMDLQAEEALLFARMLVRHAKEAKANAEIAIAAIS